MNDFDDFYIDTSTNKQPLPQVNGYWQRVYIEPNPITCERYNIGVILHGPSGIQGRFISEKARLKCLFDEQAINNTLFAIKHIEQIIRKDANDIKPDAFGLSEKLPASGQSEAKILDELFEQAVPLGRPSKDNEETKDVETVSRDNLIRDIYENLYQLGFEYTHIIPQNRNLVVDSSGHTIDAPLYANRQIGDIISATNKASHVINNKISNSIVDLTAAINYRSDLADKGLFILRPSEALGFNQKQIEAADDTIDKMLWKIRKNTHLSIADTPKELAENAAEWFVA